MYNALTQHWPEYAIEAGLLGTFMLIACAAAALLNHPASPVATRITHPVFKRGVVGMLMGLTAVALIYSPFGQRSGAHMNPATTLTFAVLGKVRPWDAAFYIAAQFIGGLAGVALAWTAIGFGRVVPHASVNFVMTRPRSEDRRGVRAAWTAEFFIAFMMMLMVLASSNTPRLAPYTGMFAGGLVFLYILLEAPLSGMSLNPARSFASALPAGDLRHLWVYFTAPPFAMLTAAAVYTALVGAGHIACAKLNHEGHQRCIFNCDIQNPHAAAVSPPPPPGIQHAEEPVR